MVLAVGCATPSQVRRAVDKNPDIVFDAIAKNPEKFIEAAQKASQDARKAAAARELEENFKNPKTPVIEADRAIRGNPAAPITIVEYSDFQCPYCQRGFETLEELRKKYGDQLRVAYKHMPLAIHEMARPAADYFEAVVRLDASKAYEFHDVLFKNQDKLTNDKEKFLKQTALQVGVNKTKLEAALKSEAVKQRVEADIAEAKSFGITGTPGFLINGILIKGARPIEDFEQIVERLLKQRNP